MIAVRCAACAWHGFAEREQPGDPRPSCAACGAGVLVPAEHRHEQIEAIRAHVARELGPSYQVVGAWLPRIDRFRLDVRPGEVDAVGEVELSPAELDRVTPRVLAWIATLARYRADGALAEVASA